MNKLKGNEDMVRILAVAAAFLVMCIIIGISLHSIEKIDKANQKVQDIEEGQKYAASIMQTNATTNIWEYLRNTTELQTETETTETEFSETLESGVVIEGSQEEQIESETTFSETTFSETEPEQTTMVTTKTSSTGFTLILN